MKKLKVLSSILFLLTILLPSCQSPTEPPVIKDQIGATTDNLNTQIVRDLNSIIHPLNGASPLLDDNDLAPLSFLKDAKIVGLGEATHGTKEFFQLKHRIFKYLVENYGFKAFGFEADMGESIYIDRYITKGEGNLENIMTTKMHFWTWRTQEVKDLLKWMRQYNIGKSEDSKIHYIGFDSQFITYQPDLILEYFNRVKPGFVSQILPSMQMIKNIGNTLPSLVGEYYKNISQKRKLEIADSLKDALTKIIAIKSELISKSSDFEYQTVKQLVINLIQANDVIYSSAHFDYSINYRDKYMADNAVWISNLFGANTKIAVWAHNGHIQNNSNYWGGGSMGKYLKNKLANRYQIVGFSFSKGYFEAVSQSGNTFVGLKVQLINTAPQKNSLNYILFNAKYDNFILKTADIPTNSELGKWIATPEPFFMIGAVYNGNPANYYGNILLRYYYDVLINYDITSAAVQLQTNMAKRNYFNPDTRNNNF